MSVGKTTAIRFISRLGLVIINAQILGRLLSENAEWTRLREAIEEPILLWHDEGPIKSRIKAFSESITAAMRQAKHNFRKEVGTNAAIGDWIDFVIRDFENKSNSGIVRIQINAVLAEHVKDIDQERIKKVCKSIIRLFRLRVYSGVNSVLDRKQQPTTDELEID